MVDVAGRYEIVRPLGRGGMGEVLLARQKNLNRLVVLKRVIAEAQHLGSHVRALLDEARLAARLHHPNIVTVLDVSEPDDPPFVAMELVSGVSLREMIERAPSGLPLEVALPVAIDILRGLAYAHEVTIVHRDIKPRNVMVTFSGLTKVIDFGISRWLAEGDTDTSVSGTEGYMAPEQQAAERMDGRVDQFAVGVTLREMLTGAGPDRPGEIGDAELAAIVARATARDPAQRFTDCSAFALALEDIATARALPLSPSRIERWLARELADRKQAFERDADSIARPRRQRPPTPATILQPERLTSASVPTGRGITVALTVRNGGSADGAWLGDVIQRLLHRYVKHANSKPFAFAATGDRANALALELEYRRTPDGIVIEALEPIGRTQLASATAPSVARAIEELAPRLVSALGFAGTAEADDRERAAMARLGATSVRSYRRYLAVLDTYLGSSFVDTAPLVRELESLISEDPGWPYLHGLLAVLRGQYEPIPTDVITGAVVDPTSRGARLVQAFNLTATGSHDAAVDALDALFREDDSDHLVGFELMLKATLAHRSEEADAVARRLHELRPDLMFGSDVAAVLRLAGDDDEAARVIRAWAAAAPDNHVASLEIVRVEAEAGNAALARQHAERMLLVHGERTQAFVDLFEALLHADQRAEAKRIAERMLIGSPLERARGRYRIAVSCVFAGRFTAAWDAIRKAVAEHRPFGWQSELTQCLELARSLARIVGETDGWHRYTTELADMLTSLGDAGSAAAVRFELAVAADPQARVEPFLTGLEDGPARDLARRWMLRSAAGAGGLSADVATSAGLSAKETSAAALNAFGKAAIACGEYGLAQQALRRATTLWPSAVTNLASPFHAVLAHALLGDALRLAGDADAARASYQRFLGYWGAADRALPEVTEARGRTAP